MAVLCDTQIRELIGIEPFQDAAKRRGRVSYGVSSYGYDVRVGTRFKVFTNVTPHGGQSVVDPKNFTGDMFITIDTAETGRDHVIIPPNSFALAETVETIRVPRDVLAICVGKSTYARCFRGDTRVALVDGSAPTLEDMARRADEGELFWGYSVGIHGRIIVSLLEAPRYVGRDCLLEVTLDNGEPIFATPDHLFMMRDGRMVQAQDLRPSDSLMPLYRKLARGYEMAYQPLNGHMLATHRMADEWNLRHGIYEDAPETHRHHVDHDRRNNNPMNIARMGATEHIRHHNEDNFGDSFDSEAHSAEIRAALQRLSRDPEWAAHYSRVQSERAAAFWREPEYRRIRERVLEGRRNPSDETRHRHRQATLRRFADPAERARHSQWMRRAWTQDPGERRARQADIARGIRLRTEITSDVVRAALDETGSIRGAARMLQCDRSVFRRFPDTVAAFRGRPTGRNHKVASVRQARGEHDVYCLTVPEAGNFALEAGIFVRNCGIIVNVTPLEPEWRGKVTLEISNTTPLPAKIYASEGIAQIIFIKADRVCAVSYADKGGKYQDQRGLTLPMVD